LPKEFIHRQNFNRHTSLPHPPFGEDTKAVPKLQNTPIFDCQRASRTVVPSQGARRPLPSVRRAVENPSRLLAEQGSPSHVALSGKTRETSSGSSWWR